MSVKPSDLAFYGCANMPETDGATVGGAVDFSKRIAFVDLTGTGTVDVVSSSASDTATKCQVSGLLADGTLSTPAAVTLTGQSKVNIATSFERLLAGITSGAGTGGPLSNPGGTTAVGDVAVMQHSLTISGHTMQTGAANSGGITPAVAKLQAGDGVSVSLGMILRITSGTGANQIREIIATSGYGTDFVGLQRDWTVVPDNTSVYEVAPGFLFPVSPNQATQVIRPFAGVAADVVGGASKIFYEKIFVVNNNTATAATAAFVEKLADLSGLYSGGGALDFALASALNDTGTVANRQTAPSSGITAFSSGAAPQTINVPSPQNLPSGAAPNAAGTVAVWLKLTLAAGQAPAKGSFQMMAQGVTT